MRVLPTRRDLKFHLPAKRIADWHAAGVPQSLFMNTLSVFFPVGERFFIHSVRHYRDRITDPDLNKAVAAFIGQEGMHGREHEHYNAVSAAAGQPVDRQEALVDRLLESLKGVLPASIQLSVTIALEHLTALMGDLLLSHPELLEGSDPHFEALWHWHALEETEHKAVAFDVYRTVMGSGPRAYLVRSTTLLVATAIFWALVYPFWIQNLRSQKQLGNWRDILRSLDAQWGRVGGLRGCVPGWLSYFRPGFHPWDHDNHEYLEQIDALAQRVMDDAAEASNDAGRRRGRVVELRRRKG